MSTDNQADNMERIEIVSQEVNALVRWTPVVGSETTDLLTFFQEEKGIQRDEVYRIRDEAVAVLSKCISPTQETSDQTTGLAIGYVQSGKTMSFTTLTSLARDNEFPLVIVIAGTSLNLLEQSTRRLRNDLRLDSRSDRLWHHIESNSLRVTDARRIEDTLRNWKDPNVPAVQRQTVLVTVMKHHTHLLNLCRVLEQIDLCNVPTLIVDDEADQASLNTKVNDDEISTTYSRILDLKESLPHHSFIQYTATPQAPLLINLIDTLSPQFSQLLTPGSQYVGGQEFFIANQLIRTIPPSEVPQRNRPLTSPPDSLMEALSLFLVGVTAHIITDGVVGNRSMMVHPTRRTIGHRQYYDWLIALKGSWEEILLLPENDPDHVDLIEEIQEAYLDLQRTVPNIPTFQEIIGRLPAVIRATQIEEINSSGGRTPSVQWQNSYSHILVGGQAMDRGFTVEGLTITYMPRGTGVGNADTIQQRGRFFGYKQSYIGYCRIFLEDNVRQAFRAYVSHEEDIRERLRDHEGQGEPLSNWKRAFFLSQRLRPTRGNVLDLDYIRGRYNGKWFSTRAPHDSQEMLKNNREIVSRFIRNLSLIPDKGHADRTNDQKHYSHIGYPLSQAYEQLLVPLQITRLGESQAYTGVLLQIKAHLDMFPEEVVDVYQMSQGRMRKRGLTDKSQITNLFQGRNPKRGKVIYPGDSKIRPLNGFSIQLHNLHVRTDAISIPDVPAIAIYIPRNTTPDAWLVQEQGG